MAETEKTEILHRIWAYTINLTAAAVNSCTPQEKPNELEWNSVIEFAEKHRILNLIAYAAEGLKNKPDEKTMKYLREYRKQKMVVEAQQEIEAQDASEKLSRMGVKHMFLKGCIVKNLYPSPDMRTMSDIDILIEPSRCAETVEAFVNDGFRFCGEGELHSNVERGNIYIEFHRSMVDEHYGRLNEYFGTGFSRAKKLEGFEYKYGLSREDMYIFLLAHLAKHYRYGGTGIRTLLDIYVYRKECDGLDTDYISSEVEKIGLSEFRSNMEGLADKWFSGSFDGEFDSVSSFIASGGIYGAKENKIQNKFIFDGEDKSLNKRKFMHVLNTVFPKTDEISIRYPILKKHRWLTPLFWIVRFFDTLIHSPKNLRNRLEDSNNILKINDEKVAAQRNSGIDEL